MEQNDIQKNEDDMLARYENEKEFRERQLEEFRARKRQEDQENMRSFLRSQMNAKKERENDERRNIDEQAMMWRTDKENYEEEERRVKERINKINRDNQQFLFLQMNQKEKKETRLMGAQEKEINKALLKQANDMLKKID